ncbi:MAG: hypothetical protein HYY31_02525 [Chloroflexi bacterium]|nr:hypothetical protein [Chloroflexota bacterium]
MKRGRLLFVTLWLVLLALVVACGKEAAPAVAPATKPAATPTVQPTPRVLQGTLYVLVNPNKIIEIDAEANQVVRTVEVALPGGGRWSYNDDNNYFDGKHLWLAIRNVGTEPEKEGTGLEVIALNLDNYEIAGRFPVGKGGHNIFVGKAMRDGTLPVGTRNVGTVVTIDTKNFKLLNTWNVPVKLDPAGKPLLKSEIPSGEDSVVCDADVSVGPDGVERFYYPTQDSEKVISIDPRTGLTLKIAPIAAGSKGNMLSTHPINGTVWAQENNTNTQAVLDPVSLDVIARIPTGKVPFVNSFSPDGKLSYINGNDTVVTVADTQTYRVVASVQVGANATQSAPHPNGKVVYVQISRENAVAVIDTSSWQVVKRVDLGVAPNGMFIRAR